MKEEAIITLLYPANIKNIWPEMEPMVSEVLALSDTHSSEDIREALLSDQAHLWVQWNKELQAFMVTEFVNYPKGSWLRIWLMSAKPGRNILWEKMKDEITKFANISKCEGIEVIGREGWLKKFKEAKKHSVVLRLSLTDKNKVH